MCYLCINPFPTKSNKNTSSRPATGKAILAATDIGTLYYIIYIILLYALLYIYIYIVANTKAPSIVRLFSHGIRISERLDGWKAQRKKNYPPMSDTDKQWIPFRRNDELRKKNRKK